MTPLQDIPQVAAEATPTAAQLVGTTLRAGESQVRACSRPPAAAMLC